MFFVYVIYSKKLNRYYVGTTDCINKRIQQHNADFYSNSFTSKGIPWILKLTYQTTSENAYKLERFIKSMKSKKFIEKIIQNPDILKDVEAKF